MIPLDIKPALRTLTLGVAVVAAAVWSPTTAKAEGGAQSVPHVAPRSARPAPDSAPRPQRARPAARQAPAQNDESLVERVNNGVVGLVSARVGGTYALLASEMAIVLEQGDDLRIIPMITKGSVQNIRDLLYLRGVDIAILQSDVLEFLELQKTYDDIKKKITYIAPLYLEEFHLVGGKDIASIEDLAGKKVNFGEVGSGGAITASLIFQKLKIQVEPVNMAPALGYESVKAGEIAATVYVSGKPNTEIAKLKAEDGLRLVQIPFSDAVADTYQQSTFQPSDYPNLIADGNPVETVAVSSVLAAYNWPHDSDRYKRVSRFAEAFFAKLETLQKPPFHPKWKEVDPSRPLPGWIRMSAAQDVLDLLSTQQASGEKGARRPRENTSAVPR